MAQLLSIVITGPDEKGFFSCVLANQQKTFAPSQSYDPDRALAYALREMADQLEKSSRETLKPMGGEKLILPSDVKCPRCHRMHFRTILTDGLPLCGACSASVQSR